MKDVVLVEGGTSNVDVDSSSNLLDRLKLKQNLGRCSNPLQKKT